ncbi:hypothetical protein L2E82_32724 [Cichorium intybus]|uniref:Uncharacterized protein n=1 Tax=Cichorium intybus TaxID=13427 RepID=A0ACB9BIJ2_CICIN|nr:hypothetical protein L2E82_32724 [Cichorium intybus]
MGFLSTKSELTVCIPQRSRRDDQGPGRDARVQQQCRIPLLKFGAISKCTGQNLTEYIVSQETTKASGSKQQGERDPAKGKDKVRD